MRYELHVYPHILPKVPIWTISENGKCLKGYESKDYLARGEQLYDYYFHSGGQLKWYPRKDAALMKFGPYKLIQAPRRTLRERSRQLFPRNPKPASGTAG
jgi:hypothetical protein